MSESYYVDTTVSDMQDISRTQLKRIRMLAVSSDTFPPTRVDVSVLFGEELSRRGHRIDWVLQSEAQCAKPYVANWGGGKVWVGATDLGPSLTSRVRKHVTGILHDLKLFRLLRTGSYDSVMVKDKFVSGISAVMAARMFRKKFIYWLSYPFPEDYLYRARESGCRYPMLYRIRGGIFKFLLYRILLPSADHVIVQSEQMKQDLATEGVPLEKMTPVPMGVKPEQFIKASVASKRELIPEGQRCFLYLGTFRRMRKIDFLVRVLALVRQVETDVKLYLVGSGDDPFDEQVLLEEAKRLGVTDALVMTGQLPQAAALRYVAEADVCVSPFYPTPILNSTSPTKLVEYMAMGKAVVANDHPEQKLVIEHSTGGYCVPYEEHAFANAVIKLLQNPQAAKSMGDSGRSYALKYRSYDSIAARVETALLEVAGRAGDGQ